MYVLRFQLQYKLATYVYNERYSFSNMCMKFYYTNVHIFNSNRYIATYINSYIPNFACVGIP